MIRANLLWIGLLFGTVTLNHAAVPILIVTDPAGLLAKCGAPVTASIDLSGFTEIKSGIRQFRLLALDRSRPRAPEGVVAQFEPSDTNPARGRLLCLMPPGPAGERKFSIIQESAPQQPRMCAVLEESTGQFVMRETDKPVLRYNYRTNDPGGIMAQVKPDDRKYAQPRSDYIHPLYGLHGEEITKDWSVDHPHHRGIYWAWPEVDYRGERGDLHALQRVFARPNGNCAVESGPVCAVIKAENLWRWEDKEPVVLERALIRAWRSGPSGRFIDLEFVFIALKDDIALARREMGKYGGLNIRLAAVNNQDIVLHTDAAEKGLRRAWAELSGVFAGGTLAALAVFQATSNPDYPGDWIQYPELNWFQPTFPAAGTRYVLKKDHPLTLKFRLWIREDKADDQQLADAWAAYAYPAQATVNDH